MEMGPPFIFNVADYKNVKSYGTLDGSVNDKSQDGFKKPRESSTHFIIQILIAFGSGGKLKQRGQQLRPIGFADLPENLFNPRNIRGIHR
jgi:hypothetical protein